MGGRGGFVPYCFSSPDSELMISWFGEFLSVDAAQPQQLDVLVPAWIYGWEASTWFSAGSLHLGSLSYAIWMACDGKIASFRELVWTESPQDPRNPHFLEKNHVVSPWFPMVSHGFPIPIRKLPKVPMPSLLRRLDLQDLPEVRGGCSADG